MRYISHLYKKYILSKHITGLPSKYFLRGSKNYLFKIHKDLGLQVYAVCDVVKDLANSLMLIVVAGFTNIEIFKYSNHKFFGKSVQQMAALRK